MGNLESFAYKIQSAFNVQGREELISDVAGERQAGKIHIQGEMVKTPVDIYYIDGIIYNYDKSSEKWMVIESDTSSAAALYINELNPLIYMDFRENGMRAEYEFGKLDGKECLIAEGKPRMRNELLEKIWQDFSCTLWIDYQEKVVKKIVLKAINRKNPQTQLTITAGFERFDESFSINPPDLTRKKDLKE